MHYRAIANYERNNSRGRWSVPTASLANRQRRLPPCFSRWCKKFDDLFRTKAQKREFRHYLGGLLGESERKNVSQMARDAVEVTYHKLHHFLTEATWSAEQINERPLEAMNKCSQTRINRGFSLVVDDSGHRKSGNFTAGVGRQYIGEIGKTDNGNVVVTTHLYDGSQELTFRYRIEFRKTFYSGLLCL